MSEAKHKLNHVEQGQDVGFFFRKPDNYLDRCRSSDHCWLLFCHLVGNWRLNDHCAGKYGIHLGRANP